MKRRKTFVLVIALAAIFASVAIVAAVWWNDPMEAGYSTSDEIGWATQRGPATGPLRVQPANGRHFTDGNGKTIYLTGSHTWNNLQDRTDTSRPEFGYASYLRLLGRENHNFMRLWVWEQAAWAPWTTEMVKFHPLPYLRTGPGTALDGEPKFDLTRFNQEYFERLQSRVSEARDKGIYVAVMLFQGWSVEKKPDAPGNPWSGHPFNRQNNVNGIDGDLNGDGEGKEVHTLENPKITALQETYVRKVVDTVNDLDNVLWEICNEGNPGSMKWQNHMVVYIKNYESTKEKQHPVGITALYPKGNNDDLRRSMADWISPSSNGGEDYERDPPAARSMADWISPSSNGGEDYERDPPAADGSKVIILDTDHLWGVGGDRGWVWKSFARGLNPIYMDPLDDPRWKSSRPKFESCRRAMGQTLDYANKMNLASMTPHGELASTRYCLANPGENYFVYVPFDAWRIESARLVRRLKGAIRNFRWQFEQTVTVNLSAGSGAFLVEWFNPSTGETREGAPVEGGGTYSFTAPFRGDAVLYLRKRGTDQLK